MSEAPLRSATSLPKQLARTLGERIAAGEWPAGTRLPSEQSLASQYGVSRSTVRTALRTLAEAGAVRVRQGTGTFVSPHSGAIHAGLQPLRSTSELIRAQGHECEVTFRDKRLRSATAEETAHLRRDAPPVVLAYQRAFVGNDRAHAFETGAIAIDQFPAGTDFEALTGSVFEFLEPLGMLPDQSLTHVRATYDGELAWGPHRPDPPLYLTLEQVQFLPNGMAVSWSVTNFVQESFDFHLVRTM